MGNYGTIIHSFILKVHRVDFSARPQTKVPKWRIKHTLESCLNDEEERQDILRGMAERKQKSEKYFTCKCRQKVSIVGHEYNVAEYMTEQHWLPENRLYTRDSTTTSGCIKCKQVIKKCWFLKKCPFSL